VSQGFACAVAAMSVSPISAPPDVDVVTAPPPPSHSASYIVGFLAVVKSSSTSGSLSGAAAVCPYNGRVLQNCLIFQLPRSCSIARAHLRTRRLYKHQVTQLSWTVLIITAVVAQMKTAVFSIHQGLYFLIFPASLVIVNDSAAYFCGMLAGKKIIKAKFLSLSPNKTWEGFIGAFFMTIIYAYYGSL
jgi:CDP-diglyceride synthetase